MSAHSNFSTDEGMKASSHLQDVLLDPELAFSQEANDGALNYAFKTKQSVWDWFESKGNEHRQVRLGIAMEGSKQASSPQTIKEGAHRLSRWLFVPVWSFTEL